MIKELFGKIKNKPEDNQQPAAQPNNLNQGGAPQQQVQQPTDPSQQQQVQQPATAAQSKEDVIMEQIKMLIEINKTLNDKVKNLEARATNFEQMLSKYAQIIEKIVNQQQPAAPAQAPPVQTQAVPAAQPATANPVFNNPAPQTEAQQPAQAALNIRIPNTEPTAFVNAQAATQANPNSHPLYRNANEKDYFVMHDGRTIKNSIDLLNAIKTMNESTFNYYVNPSKNDFSTWIRYCLNNEILASEIAKSRTREEAIRVIENFI